jgi:hypothetical protein
MIDLIDELLNPPPDIIAECSLTSNHRHITIEPQLYRRARICIGPKDGLYDGGYVDMWDYLSYDAALQALACWDGDGEPDGWNRHFPTKRYRIDGRSDLEYVRSDDDGVEAQVKNAIKVTCGKNRVITDVQLVSQHFPKPFPDSTKEFIVISESSTCPRHDDHVYHYLDRSVVVRKNDLHTTQLANVLQRLNGGDL